MSASLTSSPSATIKAYTATAGPYPIIRDEGICFHEAGIFCRPVMEAKRYKVLPHLFFPDAEITVWHDGNIWLKRPADELVATHLGDADLAVFCHPYRRTIWEEFAVLRRAEGRFNVPFLQDQLREQEAQYRAEGVPDVLPLFECNFLIRRRSPAMARVMDAWWAQICRWQWRDQVSFPYVLWKYGDDLKIRAGSHVNIRRHPDFTYVPH